MTARLPREELLAADEIRLQLRSGAPRIAELTAGLSADALQERQAPDEWSINENLAHLRAAADVWGGYMRRMLDEEHPTFSSINPRAHMRKTDYPDLDFAVSFRVFIEQRNALMAVLDSMSPRDWARTAAVKVYGEIWEHSVRYYGSKLARHESVHLPQIEAVARALTS